VNRRTVATGVLALGIALLASPASAAGAGVIHVPSDFDPTLSDTRPGGHYNVEGSSLHIQTTSNTSADKVAEYVDTNVPLADVGEPSLTYDAVSGTIPPGFQLVIDIDGDGHSDGILVGEPTFYGNDWWTSDTNTIALFAPSTTTGTSHTAASGSAHHGTLDEWRANLPTARVIAFGFSLGSGVQGNGYIRQMDFNGTTYTFAADVVLTSKDQCKNGGWATSYPQTFKNQGDCVSSFASAGKGRS
jgi:hypothetical protein